MPAIHARLAADPGTYPPADPRDRLDARRRSTRSWPTRNTPGTRCSAAPAKASPCRRRPVVLARPAHPSRHRGPRRLGSRPAGRGRAPQLTRRRHPQPGQLADLPVPVPGPLQDVQAAHVRPDQGARGQQDPHRVRLLRVPVQPEHPQPRRRRPRSPPHRPGPRRLPQGRDVRRAVRLRAGARPGAAPGRAHPAHRHRPASPARPAGRRPGQTAQAADRPARQPDARTGRVLRHGRRSRRGIPPPHPRRLRQPCTANTRPSKRSSPNWPPTPPRPPPRTWSACCPK